MLGSLPRRMKIAALPDYALMNCLVINGTATDDTIVKMSLDIDPGSVVVSRTYNPRYQCEDVTLYNENWPEVPLGDPFPRIEPRYSYIQVRTDIPQLGQTEQPLALKSSSEDSKPGAPYVRGGMIFLDSYEPAGFIVPTSGSALEREIWHQKCGTAHLAAVASLAEKLGIEPIPPECLVPHGQAIGDSIAGPGMTREEAKERGYVPEKWAGGAIEIPSGDLAIANMVRQDLFEIPKPSNIKGVVVKTEEPEKEEEQSWRDRPSLL